MNLASKIADQVLQAIIEDTGKKRDELIIHTLQNHIVGVDENNIKDYADRIEIRVYPGYPEWDNYWLDKSICFLSVKQTPTLSYFADRVEGVLEFEIPITNDPL